MTCTRCSLHVECAHPCIQGTGPIPCPLLICGEAPGFNEDQEGKPFVGEAGMLLTYLLEKLGVPRSSVFITNLIRCRPQKNELPKGKELDSIVRACQMHFARELCLVRPSVVLLLGGTSVKYMTGHRFISKIEGSEVDLKAFEPEDLKGQTTMAGVLGERSIKAVAGYHPAYVLRSPGKEVNLVRAIARACRLAGIHTRPRGIEIGWFKYEIKT